MTMKVPTILMFAIVLATPCRADSVMTATWFADHPDERSKVNTLCKDNPGEAKHNANCENAFQGDVIAETRAAQAKTGMRVGVSERSGLLAGPGECRGLPVLVAPVRDRCATARAATRDGLNVVSSYPSGWG